MIWSSGFPRERRRAAIASKLGYHLHEPDWLDVLRVRVYLVARHMECCVRRHVHVVAMDVVEIDPEERLRLIVGRGAVMIRVVKASPFAVRASERGGDPDQRLVRLQDIPKSKPSPTDV